MSTEGSIRSNGTGGAEGAHSTPMASAEVSLTVGLVFVLLFALLCCFAPTSASAQPATSYPDSVEQHALNARLAGLLDSSRPDSVDQLVSDLLAPARARGDSTFILELLLNRGGGWTAYGQGARSESDLREALRLATSLRDTSRMCQATRWLSVAVGLQGRGAEAAQLYDRLRTLAIASGDRDHLGWAQVGLAYHYLNLEQAEESATAYGEAATIFRELGDLKAEIWAQNGRGLALRKLARHHEAIACFERSVAISGDAGAPINEGIARNVLGELELELGDPGRAQEHFRRALEIHLSHGHTRESLPPMLHLARCQIALGRYDDAIASLERSLTLVEAQNYRDLHGMILNKLAEVKRLQRRPHEAAASARASLAIGDDIPVEIRVRGWIELSHAQVALDSIPAALQSLQAGRRLLGDGTNVAIEVELDLARGARWLDLQQPRRALNLLAPARRLALTAELTSYGIDLLTIEARAWRALAEPDSAFSRLQTAVVVWETERGLPLDPEWRERRGSAGRALFDELTDLLLDYPSTAAPAERVAAAFDALQLFKARTLIERMHGPGKALATNGSVTPVSLARVQKDVLRQGELLLDTFICRHGSLLFAVTRDTCAAHHLERESELGSRLELYHQLLAAPAGEATELPLLAATGRQIETLLWGEFVDLIDASSTVIWSPDGPLNLIPLGDIAEPAPTPAPSSSAPKAVAFGDRPRLRIPSATVLASLRNTTPWAGGASPSTTTDSMATARILAISGHSAETGQAMPGALREVQWLYRRFHDVDLRSGQAAGMVAFGGADPGAFDVLHLAAHAQVDDQRPWNSALRFGPPEQPVRVNAGQVADLSLQARLAVLASCESGLGGVLSGEGVLGLSTGFLSAGVPVVLATLWPVDDSTTAALMQRFYAALSSGQTSAEALRNAQAAVRAEAATSHPFHWAGFVLVGDGTSSVPLRERPPTRWPFVLGATLLLGALLPAPRRRENAQAHQ